jgi:hypothetical protein
MDSNSFIHTRIYGGKFLRDFLSSNYTWREYILSKDLGIICTNLGKDEYKIVDEKKWTINKIKYGF